MIGENGMQRVRELYNLEAQMKPRIDLTGNNIQPYTIRKYKLENIKIKRPMEIIICIGPIT